MNPHSPHSPHPPADLPEHIVREHPTAKRVILRVYPDRGLVVTVPKGWNRAGLPAILERRRHWIEQAMARLRARGLEPGQEAEVPARVDLAATGESFAVRVTPTHGRAALSVCADGTVLDLRGDSSGHLERLRAWLRAHARKRLLPRLEALSERTGLAFASARFGLQRSRWGSCSARRVISLNAKLLFVPPELCDQVLLHELAHTRHMDHSPAYWAFMRSIEPRTDELERALRDGWSFVPPWAA